MRPPQSINRSLSVLTLHFLVNGITLLLFSMVSMSASASVPQLASSPTTLFFGAVGVGRTETQLITVTNTGQTSTTVSEITVNNSQFTVSNLNLPLVLSAGQSFDLSVTFTPSAIEWTGGRIRIATSGDPLAVEIAGTGVSSQTLTANPTSLSFGQVATGSSATLPVTITNGRSFSVTLEGMQSADSEFSVKGPSLPLILAAGQSVTFSVTFTPQSTGQVGGNLALFGGIRLSIPLIGTGTTVAPGQLSVAPAPLNFGSVAVGSTTTKPITLSASGASVTISSAASNTSQFALQGMSFPLTIPVGQPVSFNVAFTPQNSGTESGTLSFTSNASNSTTSESLSGTGTTVAPGQLSVAPAPLNFGSVAVGSTTTQPITLSASGASVTISSAASSTSQFALQGMSLPLTIPVGQPVSLNVAFTPQNSGTQSGTLSFTSNASKSTTSESLSGTGTVTSYSVNLYWNSSSDVAGYNVYRSASANGTYAKINPSLNATTAYTDSTVVSGQTYYYEATAVSSSGMESARSTPAVQAVVP
ncbi:MAG: choice-of-anchor D domain-containing protein [Candidatus Sulfotelmatobacter sp.]